MTAWVIAVLLSGGFEVGDTKPPSAPANALVWKTAEVVEKAQDRTFVATGTKKGRRYVFHARGVCSWQSISLVSQFGLVRRQRIGSIFGIDFRVTFGSGERRIMEVGERRPQQTELTFVADQDDVPIRVRDCWDLPDKVYCTIDGIEVVSAPPEDE